MKILRNVTLAALMATSLSGCIIVAGEHDDIGRSGWEDQQKENREMINDLALQSDRSSVTMKMGEADYSEAFVKGDDEYRVLYYRTQHRHSDGDTSKDETTPLVFKNDKLIGWGDDTLSTIK